MQTVVWVNANQVSIECGVMDFRERNAVRDDRLAELFVFVLHDMGRIEQKRFGQA